MIEKNIEDTGGMLLPVFLLIIAGVGLPLGAHVFSTLAACEKKEHEQAN